MQLDTVTLIVASGIVVVLCGVSFILNTAFNRDDPPGRVWCLSFITGIMVAIAYGVAVVGREAWWGIPVGNVALVISIGALWSGTRLHNRRGSGFVVIAVLAAIVAIATLVHGPSAGEWAGGVELWFGIALLGGLGGFEAIRGRLRRNLNARILSVILWVIGLFAGARAVAALVDGFTGPLFSQYFNAGNAAMLNIALVVTAGVAVSVLRAEQLHNSAVGDFTDGIHSAAGVLSSTSFAQAAADHLARAKHCDYGLALIGADIDNLPEINTAFGRVAGDEAIARFAQTLRQNAPVMSIIGHRAAGRFMVLASVASATEALTITERIQTALVDEPLVESNRIRLTASFGIADSYDHGHSLAALSTAVNAAVTAVKSTGGNDIAVKSVPSELPAPTPAP